MRKVAVGDINARVILLIVGEGCYVHYQQERAVVCRSGRRHEMLTYMRNKSLGAFYHVHMITQRGNDETRNFAKASIYSDFKKCR